MNYIVEDFGWWVVRDEYRFSGGRSGEDVQYLLGLGGEFDNDAYHISLYQEEEVVLNGDGRSVITIFGEGVGLSFA